MRLHAVRARISTHEAKRYIWSLTKPESLKVLGAAVAVVSVVLQRVPLLRLTRVDQCRLNRSVISDVTTTSDARRYHCEQYSNDDNDHQKLNQRHTMN